MLKLIKLLNSNERRTFFLHLGFSIGDGFLFGTFLLNEVVLLKSLMGNNLHVALIVQAASVLLVFSLLFNEIRKRIKNKRKLLVVIGLITRLPLIAIIFFPWIPESSISLKLNLFIVSIFCAYFADPVILPVINTLLKGNYRNQLFGRLYSYGGQAKLLITLITAFAFGMILDFSSNAYMVVYPFVGITGIISIWLLLLIPYRSIADEHEFSGKFWLVIKDSLKNMLYILKNNRPFLDFEMGYMLYGIAYMMITPVISIIMVKVLNLSFSDIGFYKTISNIITVATLPYFGRLAGKIDPRQLGSITFIAKFLSVLFVGVSLFWSASFSIAGFRIVYILVPAFFAYGIFYGAGTISWNVSSAYFCKSEDVANYHSVHLSLVGFRASFSQLLVVALLNYISYSSVFLIALILLFFAVLILWSSKKTLVK